MKTREFYYSLALAKERKAEHQAPIFLPDGWRRYVDILDHERRQIVEVKILDSAAAGRAHSQPDEYRHCETESGIPLSDYELCVHFILPSKLSLSRVATLQKLLPAIHYSWEMAVECKPVSWEIGSTTYLPSALKRHCDRIIRYWPHHANSNDLLAVLNLGRTRYIDIFLNRASRLMAIKSNYQHRSIGKAISDSISQAEEAEIIRRINAARLEELS